MDVRPRAQGSYNIIISILSKFNSLFVLTKAAEISQCPHSGQKIHPFVSLPFGYGRRMCVGRRFAEAELLILLTKVRFSKRRKHKFRQHLTTL